MSAHDDAPEQPEDAAPELQSDQKAAAADAEPTTPAPADPQPTKAEATADEAPAEPSSEAPQEPEAPVVELFEGDSAAEDVEVDELTELRGQLEQAQARLRTVSKAYTDLQAEMKSFRERMEARSSSRSEMQAFELTRTFFEPVMNLRRSLVQPGEDMAALLDGMRMVQKQFMDAMTHLGLEEVPGEGASFDPNFHEALAVTPVADKSQDGKVLVVHTAGYRVKGKVLQAAQVVIGKYEETVGEA